MDTPVIIDIVWLLVYQFILSFYQVKVHQSIDTSEVGVEKGFASFGLQFTGLRGVRTIVYARLDIGEKLNLIHLLFDRN